MTDELMQEIEAEYLYQCRRSFETQDCGIAANLLDRIKTELSEKAARIAALEAALKELADEYAPRAFYGEADDAVQKARALLAGKSVNNERHSELEALIDECIKIAEADEGCQISHIEGQLCEAGQTIADKIRAARAALGEKE